MIKSAILLTVFVFSCSSSQKPSDIQTDLDAKDQNVIVSEKTTKMEETELDELLVEKLKEIHIEDQKYRKEINGIAQKFGPSSDEMTAHFKIIQEKDSLNLIEVKKILDERGWLGEDVVGTQGNSTLFLVIQHSPKETQLKYLPMMREAVKKNNASPKHLALLEDRVALGQGRRQIYGSQIHFDEDGKTYVAPLLDPENVDKRRKEVGLGPLADYIKRWNLVWDLEEHKEKTAKIEAEKKKD